VGLFEHVDVRIAHVARRQHGYIRRAQLRACGLSDSTIDRRVSCGQLIRVHHGVYAVGHEPRWPLARAHAAVLACGPDAVLGRRSALSLWRLKGDWIQPFEVLTPSVHRRRGITAHRVSTLAPRDVTEHAGIPVTSVARTVFDAAHQERQPRRLVNEARNRAHLELEALAELAARLPHHPSAAVLRPFLNVDPGPTRSELEDRFVWLLETSGLPLAELNVPFGGRVLDAFYRRQALIVELDSRAWHADPDAFESDRERDADHLRSAWPRFASRGSGCFERRRGRRRGWSGSWPAANSYPPPKQRGQPDES
jgi:hypothetical protein